VIEHIGYKFRPDGNYLIRKSCSHCGEECSVHAMSQSQPVELCDACSFVANAEAMTDSIESSNLADKLIAESREQLILSTIRRSKPFPLFGWFSICPINDVARFFGVGICNGNSAYKLLDAFHCVHYFGIPKEIRRRIPELVREALTGDQP
jgi:hypothetical protein